MFQNQPILIVEGNIYIAIDLSNALEDSNARVVGPAGSVGEALAILDSIHVAAAVVDFHLPDGDASPVAAMLAGKGVPFVIHAETGLPAAFAELHRGVPVLQKPIAPEAVLRHLLAEIRDCEGNVRRAENQHRLDVRPKQV
jgi:DNA-binding response OmpR family regulator